MPDQFLDPEILNGGVNSIFQTRLDTQKRLESLINVPNYSLIPEAPFQEPTRPQENLQDTNPSISLEEALGSDNLKLRNLAFSSLNNKLEGAPKMKLNTGYSIDVPLDQASKFINKGYGYDPRIDNEDFYYNNVYMKDSWFVRNLVKNPLKFVARVIPTAILKFGEGLGYVGSMITSIGSDNYWADVADNGMSNWLNGLEQSYKDKVIPVYKQAGFDEKGFFSKLLDWSFWNNEIADGVAFMASAAIPGMGFAKLGKLGVIGEIGAEGEQALNAFGKAFSVTNPLGKAASTVGLGSWAELSSWTFNTAMESAMEGQGVFKEVESRLKKLRASGDPEYANLTDDDIRKRAGNMAANTVAGNFAVLGISNAFENTLFFKPFKQVKGRAALSVTEDLGAESAALNGLGKTSPFASGLSRTRFYGTKAVEGIVMEGLWEENAQLAIQRMNQGDSNEKGFLGFWRQLGKQTLAAFSGKDEEALENIGIGGLIGFGAPIVFSKMANERKSIIENTQKAIEYANVARQKLFNITDIYERKDGRIVYEDNQPKIDLQKLAVKRKALEDIYGKLQIDEKTYYSSDYVKYNNQKALADYIKSLHDLGVDNIAGKFSTLSADSAALVGLDPASIKEHVGEYRDLAKSFEQAAKKVENLSIPSRPENMTPADHAHIEEQRKGHIYSALSDNVILGKFLDKSNSFLLESLNSFRTLSNSSLSQFPVDQLNTLIYQQKLNQQMIDGAEFKEMSELEKEYHINRGIELETQVADYKKNNASLLEDSRTTPSGFFIPTVKDEEGNKTDVKFDKWSSVTQRKISDYQNTIHKNNHIVSLFTDKEAYDNYNKWTDTPLMRKLKDAIAKQDAPQVKYNEINKGDFEKVAQLVGKMIFSPDEKFTPEELQLQQNYSKLVEEMLSKYENVLDDNRRAILKRKLQKLNDIQNKIAQFIFEKKTTLEDKKVELEILREELENERTGKKANIKRISKAIEDLSDKISFTENRLGEEQAKLDSLSNQVNILEQEIQSGSFRGAYNGVQELRQEVLWTDNKLKETRTLLQQVKQVLKNVLSVVKKLFPSFSFSKYDKIFGDEIYGEANKEAYSDHPDVVQSYTEIRTAKDRKDALEAAEKDLSDTLVLLKDQYNANKAEIDQIIADTNKFFRDKYIETTNTTPTSDDPEIDAITKGLTADKEAFPVGIDSEGEGFDPEYGFDGDTYQRPLHTKFYTTTFPYIKQGEMSKQPKEVQDYFHFVNLVTNPVLKKEVEKKLEKGELKTIIVTKNNVKALKLEDALSDRAPYFKEENNALTHFEIIPVIEEGGYLYYIDKDLNKLDKVGDKPKKDFVRSVLRRAQFTDDEIKQYSVKHSAEDMGAAIKTATDWRTKILAATQKEPNITFDFTITRGIPNKQYMQDGKPATNSVIGILLQENQIKGNTVRVYGPSIKPEINGENFDVPVGRPYIFTDNGLNEQLHAADNQLLTDEQIDTVVVVMAETLKDHVKKVEDRITKSTTFPPKLKAKIEEAGGIQNLNDQEKRAVFLAATSDPSTKKLKLFNINYTNFLSSVIYGFGPLEKGKSPHKNQIYIKGYHVFFGTEGIGVDITNPESLKDGRVRDFLKGQYHNIKFFTNPVKANRQFIEYYLDGGKIESRTWKTYSHYLLMDKYPDGKKRTSIPITTSIRTEEQSKLVSDDPYAPYKSRGINIHIPSQVVYTKKTEKAQSEPAPQGEKKSAIDIIKAKRNGETTPTAPKQGNAALNILKSKRKGEVTSTETQEDDEMMEKQAKGKSAKDILKNKRKATEKPEEPQAPEAKEDTTDDTDLPPLDLFRIEKSGFFNVEEDLDAVISDIRRMVPQFPVERLKKAIAVTPTLSAWGQFINNTIKLYELAEEGTGYHEVFEAVANKLLTDAEWRALMKEFRSRKGYFTDRETDIALTYASATEHQVKEQLAEEFRDYKLGKKDPATPHAKSFLRVIWNFIKSLFTNKLTIDTLFDRIDKGKFANRSVRESDRFVGNYRLLPELPIEIKRNLYDGATAFMANNILSSPESIAYLDEIDLNDEQIYEPIRLQFTKRADDIRKVVNASSDELAKANNTQRIKYIEYVLNNWGEFVKGHKEAIKHMRIKFEEQEESIEKQELANRNDYVGDTFLTSGKKTASKAVRFLFGTLLRFKFSAEGLTNDIKGRVAGKIEILPNAVFLPSLVNYDEYMFKALDQFQGLNDWNRIEKKMAELAGIDEIEAMKNPEKRAEMIAGMNQDKAVWTSLYMRLFGFSDKVSDEASLIIKTKLHNYVSKHAPTPYLFINGTIISSVKRPVYESILRAMESSMNSQSTLFFRKMKEQGVSVYVPNKEFATVEVQKNGEIKVIPHTLAAKDFTPERMKRFISFLGLEDYLTPDFINSLGKEANTLSNRLLTLRNALAKSKTSSISITNLDISGYTENLINWLDTKLSLTKRENEFYGINNELRQKYVIPSFASRLFAEINNVANYSELIAKYPNLTTFFAKDSIILSKLFDKEGNKTDFSISLGYMEGVKDKEEKAGTKVGKLEYLDKYYLQFNANLSGLYFTLPADSETEWLFNFGEFVEYSENLIKERGKEIIGGIFIPKLKSEIDTIKNNDSDLAQLQKSHAKSTKKEGAGSTIGTSLRFFKDILQYKISEKKGVMSVTKDQSLINDIYKAIDEGKSTEEIVTSKNFKSRIYDAIRSYLIAETEAAVDTLLDTSIMQQVGEDYMLTNLNSSFLDRYRDFFSVQEGEVIMTPDQMRSLVQYQKINSIIGNMESFKILFGDPAQYKDWDKRAKSLFSPYEQVIFDSDNQINSWLNNNKNKVVLGDESIELPINDMFRTHFDNKVKARTYDDLMVTETETLNDLHKLLEENTDQDGNVNEKGKFIQYIISSYSVDKKGNSQTNEADGQSVGTLGFARQLMMKSGWRWTKELEAYYQYDTALMRQELSKVSGKNKYEYTSKELEDLDKKIVAFYRANPPVAKISPVKTSMPFVDEYGNINLFKHSIHFSSYQIAKNFELLDVYVDMLRKDQSILNFSSVQKIGLRLDDNNEITKYYVDPFTYTDSEMSGTPEITVDLRTVGIQVETQTSGSGQTLGTQVEKDINLNLFENGIPTDVTLDKTGSPSELYEQWSVLSHEEKLDLSDNYKLVYGEKGTFTTLEQMKVRNAIEKFDELGIRWSYTAKDGFSYEIGDLTKIRQYILDELQRLDVDENTINNIQLTEDGKSFINSAETIPSYTTISNLLWSMADSAITRPKVNGKSFIQVSSAFFNKNGRKAAYFDSKSNRWITISTKAEYDKAVTEGKKPVMTSSELKFYSVNSETGETNGMEVYLPNIYLRKVNTLRKKKGLPELTSEELLEHLNKDPRLLEGVGFRIPTQATSSIEFFRIKGFLPEEFGTSVIVPSAITTKAGSDFDVDKLNTYLNNWKIGKDGLPFYVEFKDNNNSTAEERYVAYVRSNTKGYNIVRNEMKTEDEFKDIVELIDTNDETRKEKKAEIGYAAALEASVYNEGFDIFRTLPPAIKQQYYEKEIESEAKGLEGIEKTLAYIAYTQGWINTFSAREGTLNGGIVVSQNIKDKVTGKIRTEKVTLYKEEVVPILESMIHNYEEFIKLSGVTQETIDAYLSVKAELREENSLFMKELNLKIAQEIAKRNNYKPLDEFRKLPMALQNTKEALENRYFESIRNVLKSPDLLLYLLSPNSISHIKRMRNVVNEALGIEAEENKEIDYTRWISTEYVSLKRHYFTSGKYDIGIPAVAMTNYANSQVTGIGISAEGGISGINSHVFDVLNEGYISLPFKEVQVWNVHGKYFLPISVLKDSEGNFTMDKLSSYINGFVDVAKEPYIMEMGMHRELGGVYILMERLGINGKTTALFMYQPIIREFLKNIILLDSKSYFGNTGFQNQREIIDYLIEKFGPKERKYDPNYKFTDEQLVTLIRKGEQVKKGTVEFSEDEKYAQYIAFVNFLKLRVFSGDLLSSIQSSNHDTASLRSSDILLLKDLKLQKVKQGNTIVKIKEDGVEYGADSLRNDTFIRADIMMLKEFGEIFSKIGLFSLQKDNPRKALEKAASRIFFQSFYISDDDFVDYMNDYRAAMIDVLVNNIRVPRQVGDTVEYNELSKLDSPLFSIDSPTSLKKGYDHLKKKYPFLFKKNYFLKNLEITTDNAAGIHLMELINKPTNNDRLTKELLTEGMLQLANDPNPEINKFYRAIVYGAFIQFGIKYSRKSFVDLIPVSLVTDKDAPLALTDLTKPAFENIETEDLSTIDEEIQRANSHRKNGVPEKLQRSVHFVAPNPENPNEYILESKATWKIGKFGTPPTKSTSTFFSRPNNKGESIPYIHPIFVWNGYEDGQVTPWDKAPDIIKIPAVRPEFIVHQVAEVEVDGQKTIITAISLAPIVKSMQKKGDFSYLYDQLYKKVGAENPEYGRAMISSSSKGRKSVNYLYKPINKWGNKDLREVKKLQVLADGSTLGEKSILNYPVFAELADGDLISRINNKNGRIFPTSRPNITSIPMNLKPIVAKPAGPVEMDMSPENIVRIANGTKTTTIRTFNQFVKIGIKKGQTAQRMIGGDLYNVTNRGALTIEEAGGMKAILASEGLTTPEAFKYKHTKDWIAGNGKLYVYDISPVAKGTITQPVIKQHTVTKIISGGQTGVDRLGLEVAKELGIPTGGVAPKGFKTEKGSDLTLKDDFGLTEHESSDYPPRTEENVKNSDGTVIFGSTDSEKDRGTALTIKLLDDNSKPYIINPTVEQLKEFLIQNKIKTLNVAGNRGSKLNNSQIESYKSILRKALNITPPVDPKDDLPPTTPKC